MSEALTQTVSGDQTATQATSSPAEGQTTTTTTAATTEATTQAAAPFYEAFPDDLKAAPAVVKYKSVEELARGLVAAENRLGAPADQLIRLPTKPDDTAALAEIYKKLGAPETADGYKLELAEGASPEDLAVGKAFAAHMHQAGPFPPGAVKAAVDFWNSQTTAAGEAATAANAKALSDGEAALRTEFGAAYDVRTKEIGRILNELGGPELQAELEKSGFGNNVQLMKALSKVVDKIAEPGALEGANRGAGQTVMTPGQAKQARLGLEQDAVKGVALRDKAHAMHAAVVEERLKLLKLEGGQA